MTTAAQAPPPLVARLRSRGARLGPLPMANVVVAQAGLGVSLALLAAGTGLWWAALGVGLAALALGLGRWRGQWVLRWAQLAGGYLLRSRTRSVTNPDPLGLLRLLLPGLILAPGTTHDREPVGLVWYRGVWTAVLEVDTAPSMISEVGAAPTLPLAALVPCLQERGVVLESIQVLWHCYPGSTALPPSSPALRSYLELLGPLPAAARRTTWVAVRLDPRRCPAAVAERGGGVVGCHRALLGALSRVRSVLDARGVPSRPLDPDQLVRAGIRAAEVSALAGTGHRVELREQWGSVTAGGVGHASYAITGWTVRGCAPTLNALTGVRALSTTVALFLSPGEGDHDVGLRGLVRLSACGPAELQEAGTRVHGVAQRLGVRLSPLDGQQLAGLTATLPLGAPG
jgi:type VII secretion protein EccE